MQDLIAAGRATRMPSPSSLHLLLAVLCVVVADWLFILHPPGVSAVLFLVLVAAASMLGNGRNAADADLRAALIVPAAAVPALLENVSLLSFAVGSLGAITVALAHRVAWYRDTAKWLTLAAAFPFAAIVQCARDACAAGQALAVGSQRPGFKRELGDWLLPAGMSLVFALLFASANPVFADWLASLLPSTPIDDLNVVRGIFWLAVFVACRPIVAGLHRTDNIRRSGRQEDADRGAVTALPARPRVVTRSLVAFNALFAVETALDALYLVGGATLPSGMTYAEYAHGGAYPLVAAAMLAGLFVVVTIRPGSDTARDPRVRRLVYCWIAQTALLLGSSVFRLCLYVSAYSLTYWRVAAFLWMAVVGFGLLFIVLRLALDRSNSWLLRANLLTALAVLHGCCFVDIGGRIAMFNVEQALRGGRGVDLDYLYRIGPSAIPALDRYAGGDAVPQNLKQAAVAQSLRQRRRFAEDHVNWRSFTLRSRRLARYIDANPLDPALMAQISGRRGIE